MNTDKEQTFISAVLYVHNGHGLVDGFIRGLDSVLSENFKTYEIVCVNDWSTDDSAAEIRQAAKMCTMGAVVTIDLGVYHGLENAMSAGVDYASGDFVFEFDSLSADYDFGLVMDVYKRCLEGFDIVAASPQRGSRKTSRLFYRMFNRFSHTQYPLQTESFRLLSRRAINRIKQMNVSLPYRKVVYANCGLKLDRIVYPPPPLGY